MYDLINAPLPKFPKSVKLAMKGKGGMLNEKVSDCMCGCSCANQRICRLFG